MIFLLKMCFFKVAVLVALLGVSAISAYGAGGKASVGGGAVGGGGAHHDAHVAAPHPVHAAGAVAGGAAHVAGAGAGATYGAAGHVAPVPVKKGYGR